MRIEFFKTYNQIHTWTGIVAGLFLFICFVTGSLTMFKKSLNQWALQTETTLAPIEYEDYDKLIQNVLQSYPQAQADMTVYLPPSQPQSAPLTWLVEDHETHAVTQWHATLTRDDELQTEQFTISAIGDFMDHLHRTAGIPGGQDHDAVGTWVMGLVAGLYFVALVSGLIIFLPTWFNDFLTFRKGKNRKRFWVDFHNVLGITALPFHLVIALTTVVFAYHDLFYDSLQSWVYKETPMFNRPASGDETRTPTDLSSIEKLTQAINVLEPEFIPAEINFRGLNSPRATAIVGGLMDGQWVRGPNYAYVVLNPYTAEPGYIAMLPSQSGAMGKFVNGFFALHFGGFGGETVRWLYLGMGISGSLLFLTGNILWIETRRRRQKNKDGSVEQKKSIVFMAKLTVGVAMGALIGIALSFLAVKWLPHSRVDITFWQQTAYYTGFLVCIAWAFFQKPLKAAKQQLMLLCFLAGLLVISSLIDFSVGNIIFALVVSVILLGLLATLSWIHKRSLVIDKESVWA